MPHRSKVFLLCSALAALAVHGPVAAQRAPIQLAGERVRVSPADGGTPFIGVVESLSADELTVRDEAGTVRSVSRVEAADVERSLGWSNNVPRGLAIGAGVGALAGVGLGFWVENEICGSCDPNGGASLYFGGLGLAAGGLFGLIIGAVTSGEQWERVALPVRETVGLRPLLGSGRTGAVEVGLTLQLR